MIFFGKLVLFFLFIEGLAYIMNELFGGVVYAGIDTDKHRYPIGECHGIRCTSPTTFQVSASETKTVVTNAWL